MVTPRHSATFFPACASWNCLELLHIYSGIPNLYSQWLVHEITEESTRSNIFCATYLTYDHNIGKAELCLLPGGEVARTCPSTPSDLILWLQYFLSWKQMEEWGMIQSWSTMQWNWLIPRLKSCWHTSLAGSPSWVSHTPALSSPYRSWARLDKMLLIICKLVGSLVAWLSGKLMALMKVQRSLKY